MLKILRLFEEEKKNQLHKYMFINHKRCHRNPYNFILYIL